MKQTLDRRAFLTALGVGGLTLLLPPALSPAKEKPPVAGALLLAKIEIPPFHDALVLLFEHSEGGSGGLNLAQS